MNVFNSDLVSAAFNDREAHTELGVGLAAFVYETAQRGGFMRTVEFHAHNHTVDEFTKAEETFLSRVRRKHRLYGRDLHRKLVRQLRTLH
jgi:hypothetical protein